MMRLRVVKVVNDMVNPRSDGEVPGSFELRRDCFLSTEFHIVESKSSHTEQHKKTEDSKTITTEVFQETNTNEDTTNVDNCGSLGCTNMTSFLLDSASDLFPYINESSSASSSFRTQSLRIQNYSDCGFGFKCGLDFTSLQGTDVFDSEQASSGQHGGVTVVSIEGANVQYFPPRFHQIQDTRLKIPGTGLVASFRNLRDLITQVSGLEDPEIDSISTSETVPKFRVPVVIGGGFQSFVRSPDTTLRSTSEPHRTSSHSSQEQSVLGESLELTSVNEYGFFTNERIEAGLPPVVQLPEASKHFESKRNAKWRRMLSNNAEHNWRSICELQGELLKKRIRKGIPRDWRYRMWPLLTGGHCLLEQRPGEYHRLLRQPCLVERAILDDLHRTLPNHVLFSDREGQGQQALFRVLKAYAGYDPELGYAQGTGSILAGLLVVMEEESAFWTFVGLMSDEAHWHRPSTAGPLIKARNLFLEGTPLTLQVMSQLEHLLEEKMPAIAKKLRDAEIDTSLYATKWCMTLFCFVLPFQHLVRVWDVFFLEGWKVALRTCLVIIRLLKRRILQEPNEAVGGVLTAKTIAEQLPSPDVFIKMVLGTKVSNILSTWRPQEGGPDQA